MRRRTFGLSFSPSRAIGLAGLKSSIAQKIGMPLTRSGLERKTGRIVINALGWLVLLALSGVGLAYCSH